MLFPFVGKNKDKNSHKLQEGNQGIEFIDIDLFKKFNLQMISKLAIIP